jgi:hypothetical protein
MKYCALCNKQKTYDRFSKSNRKYGDGYGSYCKECAAIYYEARKQLNPGIRNHTQVEYKSCYSCRKYLDISNFNKKISNQDGHNNYCRKCWRRMVLKGL